MATLLGSVAMAMASYYHCLWEHQRWVTCKPEGVMYVAGERAPAESGD